MGLQNYKKFLTYPNFFENIFLTVLQNIENVCNKKRAKKTTMRFRHLIFSF